MLKTLGAEELGVILRKSPTPLRKMLGEAPSEYHLPSRYLAENSYGWNQT